MSTLNTTISRTNITLVLPEECPICKSAISPKQLYGAYNCDVFCDNSDGVVVVFGCPRCHELFIAKYEENVFYNRYEYTELSPIYPAKKEFDPILTEISPMFIEIYNQALAAESYGLNHISGMGYRKALEFLIKDYAKVLEPEASEEIEKMMLSPCIQKYISHPKIKVTATASAWLGNDETHYIRKFTDKDIEDLKHLLNSCVFWKMADRDADIASGMITK